MDYLEFQHYNIICIVLLCAVDYKFQFDTYPINYIIYFICIIRKFAKEIIVDILVEHDHQRYSRRN